MTGTLAARRFLVSGKVQGVFFRASAVRQAEQLGLRGFARNLADGRVEVLAVGDSTSLGELAAWLRRGPALAEVTGLAEQDEEAAPFSEIKDFRVL